MSLFAQFVLKLLVPEPNGVLVCVPCEELSWQRRAERAVVEHIQVALHSTVFLWDDGADSCVGPIFDALAGWWVGGESDPEHRSQCSFDPELTQSDPKQLRSLAGEVSAVVIPGTK